MSIEKSLVSGSMTMLILKLLSEKSTELRSLIFSDVSWERV